MLRLTRTSRRPREVVLKAEGRIVAEWVRLLEQECLELMAVEEAVVLDLGEVSYLDSRAVRLLKALGKGPVSIINCSPLVEELLAEEAS